MRRVTLIERDLLNPPTGNGNEPPNLRHALTAAANSLRNHFWLLITSVSLCLALAVLSILSTTPVYQATTTIYIDPREAQGFREAGGILLNSDALVVDSEVEILTSYTLAERVVEKLGLDALEPSEEQEPPQVSFTSRLKSLLNPGEEEGQTVVLSPEQAAMRRAVSQLRQSTEIGRLGNTYVIEITVKNTDKQKVAAIANAYAEEYLASGLEVQAQRLSQLNSWSSTALSEAVESLETAEQNVNEFRLVNQIDAGEQQVVSTELLNLNTALVTLRNERFDDELLLDRITALLADGSAETDLAEVDGVEIQQIRSAILKIELDYARMTVNGTRSSLQAEILAKELEAMKSQLLQQYQRIAQELEAQIEFSLTEEQKLEDRAAALRADVAHVSDREAKLRELQMRANGARAVYQALLTRFHETSDDFAYNTSSARILSVAQVPAGPSAPRTTIILALGLVGGVFLAVVAIFLFEQLDTRIRAPHQIENLGLRYLGAIPRFPKRVFPIGLPWLRGPRAVRAPALTGRRRERELAQLSYAVDYPLSEFSETVRSIVFDAVDRTPGADKAQIIVVTSTTPGQGKSTLAANLASYYAKQGKRAHLIDFDLRNPTLSKSITERRENRANNEAHTRDKDTQAENPSKSFDFSGKVKDANAADVIELINPETILQYFENLKSTYDIAVLDVGSLSESSDARMCAELADYVVLAVKWGEDSAEDFELSVARGLNRTSTQIGAVLTMVPRRAQLKRTAASYAGPLQKAAA
ncbi:MAG: exopolysaccharide transport family protein [Pseudomonadota bacterium]